MKLYEERACLLNFYDQRIGNAEPAFSIFKLWFSGMKLWDVELLAAGFWENKNPGLMLIKLHY